MNEVALIGNLCKDPVCSLTAKGTSMARFTLAVDRPYRDAAGNKQADFIYCVCYGPCAEALARRARRGSKLGVRGSLETFNMVKQDVNTSAFTVNVDRVDFLSKDGPAPSEYAASPFSGDETNPFEGEESEPSEDADKISYEDKAKAPEWDGAKTPEKDAKKPRGDDPDGIPF